MGSNYVSSDSALTIAFCLVIHDKPDQVNLFIKQLLLYEGSYVYIHVDKKSLDIIPRIELSARVTILPEHYDVKWGDYSQIVVNNYLFDFARKTRQHDFYSLHSGVDLLIRPINELINYLQKSNLYAYYGCTKLPSDWQFGGGFGRIALRWPKCFRKRLNRNSPMRYLRSLYGRLYGAGILRGRKLPEQYEYWGGADWFTLRADCVEDLLQFANTEKEFDELFVDSLSGAEIYYVSIFQMMKGRRVVSDKNMLRYIDWEPRGQLLSVGSPNTCKMGFLEDIEKSDAFFARKFDMDEDAEIVEYFLKNCGVTR